MTYKIDISTSDYKQWADPGLDLPKVIMQKYPEIVWVSDWIVSKDRSYRTFEFESETHYHWFLLKQ